GAVGGVVRGLAGAGAALLAPILAPLKAAGSAVGGLVGQLLGPVTGALGKIGEQLKNVGQIAQGAFEAASRTRLGLVRAGLQGTTAGEALSVRFQELNRQIASLFLEQIEKLVGALERVVDWFRSLDGDAQRTIGRLVTFGAAALGVAAVLPKIIGGLQG